MNHHRNPSRHLPESSVVRLGANTPAYGCSFLEHVDTVEALLRLLLRLRMIRDLRKELQRSLKEMIDYDHYIDALFVGPGCSNPSSAVLRVWW